jgi:hypothetical protein
MLEIYNIEQVTFDYSLFLFALLILIFGILLIKIKLAPLSIKELETPFKKIKNLVDLNKRQNEFMMFTKVFRTLPIFIGTIMLLAAITPNFQTLYYSHLKTNNNTIGIVENLNVSESFNLQMISFNINNISFSTIKDSRFNQNLGFSNGDSLSINYTITSNKEVDMFTKIIKLNN